VLTPVLRPLERYVAQVVAVGQHCGDVRGGERTAPASAFPGQGLGFEPANSSCSLPAIAFVREGRGRRIRRATLRRAEVDDPPVLDRALEPGEDRRALRQTLVPNRDNGLVVGRARHECRIRIVEGLLH
jgi:hypothetical protein